MQDHQGHQVPLADHIRGIVPDRIPNGTKEGIYQAFLELAELAELGVGQRQGSRLHRTVQFLEQALDSLRCPENPGAVEEGERPSPCTCCYAGAGLVGCWDKAYDTGFETGYREAAQHLPRFGADG